MNDSVHGTTARPANDSVARRLGGVFRADGRTVIVALDHGLIDGPLRGLVDPASTIGEVLAGGADAILTSYGIARKFAPELARGGLILRADGATTNLGGPSSGPVPVPFFSVDEALRLGVDALVVTAVPGSDGETDSLRNLSSVAAAAHRWGIPVLAEMVPGGFNSRKEDRTPQAIAAAARLGVELGADFIKAPYAAPYQVVVESTFAPVVILGGSKTSERKMLTDIRDALDAGGAGVAIGRNVFQCDDPTAMTAAVVALVHDNASVDQAMALLPDSMTRD
jgi:DhnA family fructose-bisphosphate aldolase class Ia